MSLVFPAHDPVTLPVQGMDKRFPLHRIYCVGRNYNDHVKEMGGVVGRDPPFFFAKPNDAIVLDGRFPYPTMSKDVHHELELVVALGPDARVFGYAVGIDFTRRDLQAEAKKLGRAWETAKAFDFSAPVSAITPNVAYLEQASMSLSVNGTRRQSSDVKEMIWSVREIIEALGQYFILKPGDIIFTGTPAGVGAVQRGDTLHAEIDGVGALDVVVV
ncbi:MAG: fumarylacetoacetate hydrolase family protein [Phyllobacteriaceae bacterium]|nr:fumarylacetoacetate hydrolase family protein [Phyllobacteriaceae bacterium]